MAGKTTKHTGWPKGPTLASTRITGIRKLIKTFFPLALAALLMGCQPQKSKQPGGEKTVVTDMLGRKVSLPAKVEQTVGIGPGALRLLVYLQAEDMVVGVEEIEKRTGRPYIFAHPGLQDRPTIGPAFTGDAELIAARQPDVIFKTYTTRGEANELQRKTGIPVVALQYVNETEAWHTLDSAIQLLGRVLKRKERARELIAFYRSQIDSLNAKTHDTPQKEKPRVYLGGLSHRGTHGINSTSPYYEPFAFIDARNVARGLRKQYNNNEGVMLDTEQLMVWNPQVVFIDLAGRSLVQRDLDKNREFFRKIEAFSNNRVYGLHPYNWYSTNYATVLANAWYAGSVLYPEKFEDVDPAKKADNIYRQFLGEAVYENLESEYGGYGQLTFLPEQTPK